MSPMPMCTLTTNDGNEETLTKERLVIRRRGWGLGPALFFFAQIKTPKVPVGAYG